MVQRLDASGTLRLTVLVMLLVLPVGCGDREDEGTAAIGGRGGGGGDAGSGGTAGRAGTAGTGGTVPTGGGGDAGSGGTLGNAGTAGTGGTVPTGGGGDAGSGGTPGNAGTAGTGGVATDGGNPVGCPPQAPDGIQACSLEPNVKCAYVHQCNSGDVRLQNVCRSGRFELVPEPCAMPYDSCPGTGLHCDEQWLLTLLPPPDSPGPCPSDRPVDGSACSTFGASSTWKRCGYACDRGTGGWTVVECVRNDGGSEQWQSDGACR
jgi:hypothetical protein